MYLSSEDLLTGLGWLAMWLGVALDDDASTFVRELGLIASAAIAWAIYNATRRAGQRQPFHPSVSRTFGVAALVSMSAVAGDRLHQIGMTLAVRSLDWDAGAAPSAIFRHGAQLQNEREQLRRETEALA